MVTLEPAPRTMMSLTAGLATLFLTACPCDGGLRDFFADELHESCDGLPCEWELVSGDARFVPFLHEGERALEVDTGGVLTRPLPALQVSTPVEDSLQVFVLAACDSATELVFELSASDSTTSFGYQARLDAGAPSSHLALPRRELPLSPSLDAPTSDHVTLDTLTLRVEGPGRCTLDDLHLVATQMTHCF